MDTSVTFHHLHVIWPSLFSSFASLHFTIPPYSIITQSSSLETAVANISSWGGSGGNSGAAPAGQPGQRPLLCSTATAPAAAQTLQSAVAALALVTMYNVNPLCNDHAAVLYLLKFLHWSHAKAQQAVAAHVPLCNLAHLVQPLPNALAAQILPLM